MASKQPIVRQIAWLSLIPQLLLLALLNVAAWALDLPMPWAIGAGVYLVLSISLRYFVARAHRRGIGEFKRQNYSAALPAFQESYDFFTRNAWIDRYRYLALLSSSRICYREMALLNVAFCHVQLGDGVRAEEYYRRTLDEFPDSEMARSSLRMIEAVKESAGTADLS